MQKSLTIANQLIHDAVCAGYADCTGAGVEAANDLLAHGASDAELLEQLEARIGRKYSSLANFVARNIQFRSAYCAQLAAYGRVDADAVVSADAMIADRDPAAWGRPLHPIVACILGIVADDHGRLSRDPSNVVLPDGVTRDTVSGLQVLYAAQRAALADGPPVDPELIVAAWPGGVTLTFEHVTEHGEEVRAWLESLRAKLVHSALVNYEFEDVVIGRGSFRHGCMTNVQSSWTTQSREALLDRLSSEYDADYANYIQARAECTAAFDAYASAREYYKAVMKKSADSYIATLPKAHFEPAATPINLRGAIAELTAAVAALDKLLGRVASVTRA